MSTDAPDYESPRQICWATYKGMLCDRIAGHLGWHVDIYGSDVLDHIWPPEYSDVAEPPLTPASAHT